MKYHGQLEAQLAESITISFIHTVFFGIGLVFRHQERDLGCYLYHSEKMLTHPTPPGLTVRPSYLCASRSLPSSHSQEAERGGTPARLAHTDTLVRDEHLK